MTHFIIIVVVVVVVVVGGGGVNIHLPPCLANWIIPRSGL